ncbi:MAG: phage holin family protein [Eubacteriales bacterium]
MTEVAHSMSVVLGGFMGWFLGGYDGFLHALLLFVVIDYITGVMVAIVKKTLSSEVGFKGIFRKMMIFGMVGIAHVVDSQIIGNGSVLRTATIFFYASNEGISILENATLLELPVPEKLKDVLAQLKDEKTQDSKEDE